MPQNDFQQCLQEVYIMKNMSKKYLGVEIAGVVLALVVALLFSVSPLSQFDLQIVALLFIIYFFSKRFFFNRQGFIFFEALLFVFIIVSTVFSTGGVTSPFFFLLYFLLFAVALILEPVTGLVLTISLVIVLLGTADYRSVRDLLPVLSLPFIAPFAKYLGDLQRRYFRQKEELKAVTEAKVKSEHVQRYEKEQTLIFLTTVFHRHLDEINDRLSNFLGDNDLEYLKGKVKKLEEVVNGFKDYVEKIN